MKTPPEYQNPQEFFAWNEGYTDGWRGEPISLEHCFPNAYSSGYWHGRADREEQMNMLSETRGADRWPFP